MIVNPDIERFLLELLPERNPVFHEMEQVAARQNIPIVGPVVGNFLAQLVRIARARRIFELGSAIGYSTAWLALAAGPDAEVHYTDWSGDKAAVAREYLRRLGLLDRVVFHVGDAVEALRASPGEFDFIFNDIEKTRYLEVLELAPAKLRPGGLLVSDNALWHGRVLQPSDESSRQVWQLDYELSRRPDFVTSLVPLRDGLLVAFKLMHG